MGIDIAKKASTEKTLIDLGDNGCAIDDVFSLGTDKPVSGGLFTVAKHQNTFEYTYKYDEVKIVLEGEMDLIDKASGVKTEAKAGDVLSIPAGTTVIFSSASFGRAFYAGARKLRDF